MSFESYKWEQLDDYNLRMYNILELLQQLTTSDNS